MMRFPRLVSEEDRFLRETNFLSQNIKSSKSRMVATLQIA